MWTFQRISVQQVLFLKQVCWVEDSSKEMVIRNEGLQFIFTNPLNSTMETLYNLASGKPSSPHQASLFSLCSPQWLRHTW